MSTLVKRIVERAGSYCVVSETTGRGFGCYQDRAAAEDRLAQIERLSKGFLDSLSTADLVRLHDGCHKAQATPDLIAAHDLIEEHLEARQVAPGTSQTTDEKLAAISAKMPLMKAEDRYTLAPVYVPGVEDADGEHADADTLQKALWEWVRKGDRAIYLQHTEKAAGEMVEILTWPFPIETDLAVPGQGVAKFAFPAETPFMGVVWDDWAWDLIKQGELRGYSIGGKARRVEVDLADAGVTGGA